MNLQFEIAQEQGKQNYYVTASVEFQQFENSIKEEVKETLKETFRDNFDLEYISAEIMDKDPKFRIKIFTNNRERIDMLHERLNELFSKLPEKLQKEKKKEKISLDKFPPINLN